MITRSAGRSWKKLMMSRYLKSRSSPRSSQRASPKKRRLSSEVSLESWIFFTGRGSPVVASEPALAFEIERQQAAGDRHQGEHRRVAEVPAELRHVERARLAV